MNFLEQLLCKHDYEVQVKCGLEGTNGITGFFDVMYSKECKKCRNRVKISGEGLDQMPPPYVFDKPDVWHKYNPQSIPTYHISDLNKRIDL